MFQKVIHLFINDFSFFGRLILTHLGIALTSAMIATVLGIWLGLLLSSHSKYADPVISVINVVYTIPSIAMLGFLIPISGIGNGTAVIALIIYALLPMVRSTYTGIQNIDPVLLEAAYGMGSTDKQVLYKIKLPLALPIIMASLRNMVTMTIALTGIASFVGAGGLGVAIYRGITSNNTAMIIVGSSLVALLALGLDAILGIVNRQLLKTRRINKSFPVIAVILILALMFGTLLPHLFLPKKTVNIATKPVTEGYILGDIVGSLIEEKTDLKVNMTYGVGGGTSNIHPAMLKGDFDIYPEYTGTIWKLVLGEETKYYESKFDEMLSKYEEDCGITFKGLYGFNSTYGIAVRKETAEKYKLKTYSDLSKVSGKLAFGAGYDFYEREDGFRAVAKEYNFRFKKEVDMDNGLKYQALRDKKIDAINVFTTDGQIAADDIVVLKDDRAFYPSYLAGTVVRMDVLEKHPELESVLMMLDGVITEKRMSYLNSKVETEGMKPKEVAVEFLKEIGLLEQK